MNGVRPPLVAVLAVSALTLILAGRPGGPMATGQGAVRSMARATFVPAEAAGEVAFGRLQAVMSGLRRGGDLAAAEAGVGRERNRADSEAARADALVAENARLAALLGLDGPSGAEGVAARVVSTPVGSSGGTLTIDRGSAAGIRVGMPVVSAGGLVGRIVEVASGHSTVLPLTDPASAVGVRSVPVAGSGGAGPAAGAAAVAQGRGGRNLHFDLLDPTVPLQPGDPVVTSGFRHSRFPAGLPVGRLVEAGDRFAVEPFDPPGRLELVKVLHWVPEW